MFFKERISEWLLVGSLISILSSLFFLAKVQSSALDVPVEQGAELVSVEISGAVKKPGNYTLESGSYVKDFLRKAIPGKYADLGSLNLEEAVKADRTIVVDQLKELKVSVSGAIIEGEKELIVPIGARVSDLKALVELKPDADKKVFKSRRLLKNNEKITVKERPTALENEKSEIKGL